MIYWILADNSKKSYQDPLSFLFFVFLILQYPYSGVFWVPSKFKRISSQVTTRELNTRTQTTTTTMARIKIPIADPWTRIQSDPINLIVLNTSREGNRFIRFYLYIRWSEILLIQNRFLSRLLESWLAVARIKKAILTSFTGENG